MAGTKSWRGGRQAGQANEVSGQTAVVKHEVPITKGEVRDLELESQPCVGGVKRAAESAVKYGTGLHGIGKHQTEASRSEVEGTGTFGAVQQEESDAPSERDVRDRDVRHEVLSEGKNVKKNVTKNELSEKVRCAVPDMVMRCPMGCPGDLVMETVETVEADGVNDEEGLKETMSIGDYARMNSGRNRESGSEQGDRVTELEQVESEMSGLILKEGSNEMLECQLIFAVFGCCAAIFWETLLNCLPLICEQLFWSFENMSDAVSALFNISILLGVCYLTFKGNPMNKVIMHIGIGGLALGSLAVSLVCQFYPNKARGYYVLILACCVAGLASGFAESSAFAYAVCLHREKLPAAYSFGFGFSGIISFLGWLLWTRYLFEPTDLIVVWMQQALNLLSAILSLYAFVRLLKMPSYKKWKRITKNAHADKSINTLSHSLLPIRSTDSSQANHLSFSQIIWKTRQCQFHLFLTLLITYAIVPNVLPMRLPSGRRRKDILMGVYQVADFAGRLWSNWDPRVYLNEKVMRILSGMRILAIGLATALVIYPSLNSGLVEILFLIFLGMSNGWLLTVFMVYLTRPLKDDAHRGVATSFNVLVQLSGCVLGLALDPLWDVIMRR